MDFNSMKTRLERLHSSVGARFEEDIEKCINIKKEVLNNRRKTTLSFDNHTDDGDMANKVMMIIHNLYNLKDHLKRVLEEKGDNPQDIEEEINNCKALRIVADLSNQEKHGYPLDNPRTNFQPKIERIKSVMSLSAEAGGTSTFTMDPITGEHEVEGNAKISISAIIRDSENNNIFHLSGLIDESMNKWEEVINKYNIRE